MSVPWLYCAELKPGELELADSEARHALQSLRLRTGDELTLFDGSGRTARAVLIAPPGDGRRMKHSELRVRVLAIEEQHAVRHALTLVVASCKGPRLDWLVEKATELGVKRLVLADFERSVVRAGEGRIEKLRRTALEACKQCRRALLPEIVCGGTLLEAIQPGGCGATVLVAHPDPSAPLLAQRLTPRELVPERLTIVIGPEGGITEAELALLRDVAAATHVRLGRYILRVETAAIAAAATWAASAE